MCWIYWRVENSLKVAKIKWQLRVRACVRIFFGSMLPKPEKVVKQPVDVHVGRYGQNYRAFRCREGQYRVWLSLIPAVVKRNKSLYSINPTTSHGHRCLGEPSSHHMSTRNSLIFPCCLSQSFTLLIPPPTHHSSLIHLSAQYKQSRVSTNIIKMRLPPPDMSPKKAFVPKVKRNQEMPTLDDSNSSLKSDEFQRRPLTEEERKKFISLPEKRPDEWLAGGPRSSGMVKTGSIRVRKPPIEIDGNSSHVSDSPFFHFDKEMAH